MNVLDSMDKTTGEDRIKVVSFDGGEDQMKLLEDGKIDGLIVQNPYGIGIMQRLLPAQEQCLVRK